MKSLPDLSDRLARIAPVLCGRSIAKLPPAAREAVLTLREYEEEGAYRETLLADWCRAETRAYGGAAALRDSLAPDERAS